MFSHLTQHMKLLGKDRKDLNLTSRQLPCPVGVKSVERPSPRDSFWLLWLHFRISLSLRRFSDWNNEETSGVCPDLSEGKRWEKSCSGLPAIININFRFKYLLRHYGAVGRGEAWQSNYLELSRLSIVSAISLVLGSSRIFVSQMRWMIPKVTSTLIPSAVDTFSPSQGSGQCHVKTQIAAGHFEWDVSTSASHSTHTPSVSESCDSRERFKRC